MILRDYITQWRERAPWSEDFQVEQDLIVSRALVDIFSNAVLAGALAFRGGTALYKLYLPPARYSEDTPAMRLRLKVEMHTREHFAVLGFAKRAFSVDSRSYSGMRISRPLNSTNCWQQS